MSGRSLHCTASGREQAWSGSSEPPLVVWGRVQHTRPGCRGHSSFGGEELSCIRPAFCKPFKVVANLEQPHLCRITAFKGCHFSEQRRAGFGALVAAGAGLGKFWVI